MKRKTLSICIVCLILQMCSFTGCSDDKSKDTPENAPTVSESETSVISQDSSEISSDIKSETVNSDIIMNTDKNIILPEMDIEDDISETSQQVSAQSDKADTANNDNKAVTTKTITTHKQTVTTTNTSAKNTTTVVTTKNNTSRKEITIKTVTTAVPSESKTTVTTKGAIELPEIDFN